MDNLSKLKTFHEIRSAALAGGGEEKIKAQKSVGKNTARERISLLFDEGSFIEIDSFLKNRNSLSGENNYADGVVAGYGTVDGRLIYCYSQDYTVLNGSLGEMNSKKIVKLYDLALKTGAPIISIFDCGGIRLEEGLDSLCSYNEVMKKAVEASGVIPQISIIAGPCAGSMTFVPSVSDFVFMIEKNSEAYVTSKEVLKAVNNEENSIFPNALFNAQSYFCDFVSSSEENAIREVKYLLSYLPSNYLEDSIICDINDDINRISENIINIIPNDDKTAYDVRDILKEISDSNQILEVSSLYAGNMFTGFIKIGGLSIGVVANQPLYDNGLIDNNAAKKAASFINFCDSFEIPILSLTDSEGFKPTLKGEENGMAIDIAKLGFAFANATVPKVNIYLRKAYGGAYLYMNSKQLGADFAYAMPTAIITAATPEISMDLLYEEELKKSQDPIKARQEIIEKYKDEVASPYEAAKRGYIDDIIDPKDLRPVLYSAFDVLMSKRITSVSKKHGNIPI